MTPRLRLSNAPPSRNGAWAWCIALALALVVPGCRAASERAVDPVEPPEPPPAPPTQIEGRLLPSTEFLPTNIASPIRAHTGFAVVGTSDSEIEEAGNRRFLIRMGGPIGVVRFHPAGDPEVGFQVDLEIGFAGQFDASNSLDIIGWNGIFGFRGAYKPRRDLALHFGTLHNSSHVGDEYAERTGRERIEYTREEAVVGASWWPDRTWRLYTETGIAFGIGGDQERLRVEAGAEYVGLDSVLFAGTPWYWALDLDAYEERDWMPAIASQLGVMIDAPDQGSRVRFAIEAYRGRSWVGEFSFDDETYVGVGVFYDL